MQRCGLKTEHLTLIKWNLTLKGDNGRCYLEMNFAKIALRHLMELRGVFAIDVTSLKVY